MGRISQSNLGQSRIHGGCTKVAVPLPCIFTGVKSIYVSKDLHCKISYTARTIFLVQVSHLKNIVDRRVQATCAHEALMPSYHDELSEELFPRNQVNRKVVLQQPQSLI